MQTAPGQIYLDFHSGFKKSVYETWAKSFKKHNSFFKKKKQYKFVEGIEYCTVHQNSPGRKLKSKITDSVQNGQKTHKIR